MPSKSRGGLSKREYKAKYGKDASSSSSSSSKKSSSSSKDEKKAKKQVKKYYGEKKSDIETKAKTETDRLQQDLEKLMADVGIAQTRATQDYIRNIGNIEANKNADITQLNDYVTVNRGRTQEDLATSLAKELRRFTLESDQINQTLADQGRTFSKRRAELIAREGTAIAQADIQTEASRSFADIARYETAKNAEIQLKYGQATEAATVAKTRTLEDILNEQQQKTQAIQRAKEDIAFGKAVDLRDLEYNKNDTLSSIGNYYDAQTNSLRNTSEKTSVLGA